MRTLCTCPKCGTSAVVIASAGREHPRYPRVAATRCPRALCGHDFLLELPLADEEATVFEIRQWRAQRRRACVRTTLSLVPRALFGLWCFPMPHLPERVFMIVLLELNAQGMRYAASLMRRNHGAGMHMLDARSTHWVTLLMVPLIICLAVGVIAALGHAVLELEATRSIVRGRWRRTWLIACGDSYR